jgi:hypothetical protein
MGDCLRFKTLKACLAWCGSKGLTAVPCS